MEDWTDSKVVAVTDDYIYVLTSDNLIQVIPRNPGGKNRDMGGRVESPEP